MAAQRVKKGCSAAALDRKRRGVFFLDEPGGSGGIRVAAAVQTVHQSRLGGGAGLPQQGTGGELADAQRIVLLQGLGQDLPGALLQLGHGVGAAAGAAFSGGAAFLPPALRERAAFEKKLKTTESVTTKGFPFLS